MKTSDQFLFPVQQWHFVVIFYYYTPPVFLTVQVADFVTQIWSLFSHDGDDKKRPVIIHRAILGSVERMIAILTENYGGKWYG